MRVSIRRLLLAAAVCSIASMIQPCRAKRDPTPSPCVRALPPKFQAEPKFTFHPVLQGKQRQYAANDRRARRVARASDADRAEWTSRQHYRSRESRNCRTLSTRPGPHAAGAVRRAERCHHRRDAGPQSPTSNVDAALVTPTMTRCMKSLQAGKIVVVHVQSDAAQTAAGRGRRVPRRPHVPEPHGHGKLRRQRSGRGSLLEGHGNRSRDAQRFDRRRARPAGRARRQISRDGDGRRDRREAARRRQMLQRPNCKHNQKGQ